MISNLVVALSPNKNLNKPSLPNSSLMTILLSSCNPNVAAKLLAVSGFGALNIVFLVSPQSCFKIKPTIVVLPTPHAPGIISVLFNIL
jgi:hypothetical protein